MEGIFPVIMRATLQQAAGRVQTFSKQASGNILEVIKDRYAFTPKYRISF
jgi:hypothetical protein